MSMTKIGIVGCGLMGSGIAEVCARADLDVVVAESTAVAAEAGRQRLQSSLQTAEGRGKISSASDVMARIRVSQDLEALADRDVVIEGVVEDVPVSLTARSNRAVPT